jgi:hypothetical protein
LQFTRVYEKLRLLEGVNVLKRRNLLLGSGGYSLAVLASQLPAAAQSPGAAEIKGQFQRPEFARLAPSKSLAGSPEPNMSRVDLKADILVAGGGLAGVCAAISAARQGAKVILVQDRSRLGGNSSSEVKMHVVGASCHKGRPGWRESGLIEEIRLEDAVRNPQRSWEMWDLLLYDKVVSEPNITLLLDSTLFRATKKGDQITQAWVRCDRTEHLYSIEAKIFVDATGDSRLGLEAGAEFRTGREAQSEFGEKLAPVVTDQETLGSSILFTSRLYRKPMPFTPPPWARKVTKETLRMRKITSWEYGYWWIEWGGNRDPIRDNELIRFELLSIVMGVWDYIKNSGEFPESDHYAMDWVGMMPGKRGSRRLVGDYMLTEKDLVESTVFSDAVAMGGWPLDDHPPGGFDRADLPPNTSIKTKEVFSIPLRSLYSKNVSNLLMAGRNISASHVAFTSTRVMATCAVIGQAVGAAAAMCVEKSITPRALQQDPKLLSALQQRLVRDDQTITSVTGADPEDLAKSAVLTASASRDDVSVKNLVNGHLRDLPNRSKHHWAAPLNDETGAWVDLTWAAPRTIQEIQLTFDTGFQRELTLTSSENVNRGIIRAPQPETVKDYQVLYRETENGNWKTISKQSGNYQRVNRLRFAPIKALAIRIQVSATHGDAEARIFEVRCYA